MTLPTPYFQDDAVVIYHADARDILPLLEPVEFMFTSPPYVDQRVYSGQGFPVQKEEWLEWLLDVLKIGLTKARSVAVNIGDRRRNGVREWDSSDFAAHARAHGIPLWERFVWVKYPYLPNGSVGQPDDPCEFVLWFGMPVFNTDAVRRPYAPSTLTRYQSPPSIRHESNGTRKRRGEETAHPGGSRPATVLTISHLPTEEFTGHPAQFPLELPAWFIAAGTTPGDVVIDPFCGSGTTLRAAKNLGRNAIGIEIEERYCEIAAKRMQQGVLL